MSLSQAHRQYAEQAYAYATSGYYRDILSNVPEINQCTRILDLGAGPGGWLYTIADMLPKRCFFVAGDISEDWLTFAKNKLSSEKHALMFVRLDAQAIPISSNSFHLVISSLMLPFVEDDGKVCSEIVRVLLPGGKGLILFHTYHYYVRRFLKKKSLKVKATSLVSLAATLLLPVLRKKLYQSTFQTFSGLKHRFEKYGCQTVYRHLDRNGIGIICVKKK